MNTVELDLDLESRISGLQIEKRDYQLEAARGIIEQLPNSTVLNYPYGTGKTVIALLTLMALKSINPGAKMIFTSAREAAALRCRQALEMAKTHGFIDELGYLFDPKTGGKGLSIAQRAKMYSAADAIFAPVAGLMNDRFRISRSQRVDTFENVQLCVIDEATDVLARDMSGFRLSKHFEELFRAREQLGGFPILALTGSRDQSKINNIVRILNSTDKSSNHVHCMQRPDLAPYESVTQIKGIEREDYQEIDQTISNLLTQPIGKIREILDPKMSKLEIIRLSYGGILDRLRGSKSSFPIRIGKYSVNDENARSELVRAFVHVFKLVHSRLLLLDSTPGKFLTYIRSEDETGMLQGLVDVSQQLVSHRDELPLFDNPDETTTRGMISPKAKAATLLAHEHVGRGAKLIMFTRYVALAEQTRTILNLVKVPGVRLLTGKTPEETRRVTIQQFQEEDVNIIVFTPMGSRGLNLSAADVVVHLDITSNLDDMLQRRERARGCMEYVLVISKTSEEVKLKEYAKMTTAQSEDEESSS